MTGLSKVYFWNDRALYVGMEFLTGMHSHHAVQIIIGLDGGIGIETAGGWLECRLAFIPADAPHRIRQSPARIAALYLDNESADAIRLQHDLFRDGRVRHFPLQAFPGIGGDMEAIAGEPDCGHALETANRIIDRVLVTGRPEHRLDPRIETVLEILKNETEPSISVSRLAETQGLSLSRLGHLFKEQTGFPIRRYFLWRKLVNAVRAMETAASLTEAAHQAGFSDSSHMNRTFKRMFGITPSFFFNYSQFVQVVNCSALYM